MKYISRVIVALLIVMFFTVDSFVPKSNLAGVIDSISELKNEPMPHKSAVVKLQSGSVEAVVYDTNTSYKVGDEVLLQKDPEFSKLYSVTDFVRTTGLVKLLIMFIVIILLVSGRTGIRSLLGLFFSFTVIFKFVLPQIVLGSNPLSVALVASLIILFVSYYLSHGINDKSTIAIAGTFAALSLTGILAIIFSCLAKLTGFGNEDVAFLIGQIPRGNLYNLLLAGIIIGSLGVLDDITISQASIVAELADANHKLTFWELYKKAMNIGHDHISSLVNTLVLVYAGSALPLLLLFIQSNASPLELLNYEPVAEEIVRTLVGSIGLVAAVPFTTMIAAYWYDSKR